MKKGWDVWYRLLRPHTLTAGIMPVLIGTALAIAEGHRLSWGLFAAMLLASVLIQSATNMFNEYYDYKRGLDTPESVGISGTIVRDGVAPEVVLRIGMAFFGAALLLGVYICAQTSWWIALIGAVSMGMGYFYTGGPWPVAYTPFGEVAAGLFMGPVIVLIAYFIQAGTITGEAMLASIPIAILVAAILLSNNIRDLDGDKEKGRRTVAILLGRPKAIRLLAIMFACAYLWTIGLVLFGWTTPWLLLVLLSLPKAWQAVRRFQGKQLAREMMPAMKATAQLHTQYGLLFSLALLFEFILVR